jgi:glycosyltransferase involved in cell wall biosynthesis
MHLVSVIIPSYKQAVFLPEAIESVRTQTYRHYEIIVVDDGSPDETARVARGYAEVRYFYQDNKGVSAARNLGIRESLGSYLVFLDADDRLLPDHLSISLEAFEKNPGAAFVCGQYRCFGAASPGHIHNCEPLPDHYGTLLRGLHDGFIGSLITVMLQRKVLLSIDGFKEDLLAGEDYEILLRILKRYPMHCHHQYVAEYRTHDMQMTRNLDRILEGVFRVYRLERRFVKAHPEYLEAYQAGIKALQDSAGEPLIWQMVSAARSANWKLAIHLLVLLLRFYPDGIANLLRHKLAKALSRSPVARSDN